MNGRTQMLDRQKTTLLNDFKAFYQQANSSNLERMDRIYTQDVEFRDPLHTILGILALKSHFKNLSAKSNCVEFQYTDEQCSENSATIGWYMELSHSARAGGKTIKLRGVTQIRFTDRIYYHEDFYDLGAMLYQQIPVLGAIVRFVNNRVRF